MSETVPDFVPERCEFELDVFIKGERIRCLLPFGHQEIHFLGTLSLLDTAARYFGVRDD